MNLINMPYFTDTQINYDSTNYQHKGHEVKQRSLLHKLYYDIMI